MSDKSILDDLNNEERQDLREKMRELSYLACMYVLVNKIYNNEPMTLEADNFFKRWINKIEGSSDFKNYSELLNKVAETTFLHSDI